MYPADPLPAGRLLKRGKVRDIYDAGPGRLLVVATDRISAFDVVLSPGIPGKGAVLTQLSTFWFQRFERLVPNHLLETDAEAFPGDFAAFGGLLAGRSVLVK